LTAKIISILLIVITVALLYAVWYFFLNDKITLVYLSVGVVLPLLFVIFKVIVSSERKQLHLASRMMKIVMIAGVLYSVVVKILLDQNLV